MQIHFSTAAKCKTGVGNILNLAGPIVLMEECYKNYNTILLRQNFQNIFAIAN
jgi:hypothetical protein